MSVLTEPPRPYLILNLYRKAYGRVATPRPRQLTVRLYKQNRNKTQKPAQRVGDAVLVAPRSPLALRCRWAPWRRDGRRPVAQERRAEPALGARHSAGGRGAARRRCAAAAHTFHRPEPESEPTPHATPEAKPKPSPNPTAQPKPEPKPQPQPQPQPSQALPRSGRATFRPGGADTYAQGRR